MQSRQLYLGIASLVLAVVAGPMVAQAASTPTNSVAIENPLLQKVGHYDDDRGSWGRRHSYRRWDYHGSRWWWWRRHRDRDHDRRDWRDGDGRRDHDRRGRDRDWR